MWQFVDALGTYVDIDFAEDLTAKPLRIYVKFNDFHIGQLIQNSSHRNAIPIEPIIQEFYANGRIIIHVNFPLIPCWECTVHKMQGLLLNLEY